MSNLSGSDEMPEVIIDEEFRVFLTPLDPEAYARLEIDILEHGIIYPLLLWNGILIDGYNRFNIASEHNIPFKVENVEFDSREEVKIWIITNHRQLRNTFRISREQKRPSSAAKETECLETVSQKRRGNARHMAFELVSFSFKQ